MIGDSLPQSWRSPAGPHPHFSTAVKCGVVAPPLPAPLMTLAPRAFCAGKGRRSRSLFCVAGSGVFAEPAAPFAPLPAMGLLELCEELFGTADLYQVLGVRREASDSEVRRGYHKVSLQVHPDRVGEGDKEDATRRFQVR